MNRKLQSLFSLAILFSFTTLVAAVCAIGAWADNPCRSCSCSGNGTCAGCRVAVPLNNCNVQLGWYVSVPSNSYYNYCDAPGTGTGCDRACMKCYDAPAGVNIYTDSSCTTTMGTLPNASVVTTPFGCNQ
jgi:hypothetical protein